MYQHKNLLKKQSIIRNEIILNLKKQLDSKGLAKLVIYGDDKEYILGILPSQLLKIELQGRHILKVLTIVSRCYDENGSIT